MPTLTSLAEEILAEAKRVDEVLERNNIPPTSFDEDTLESLPKDAQRLRSDLLNRCHDLRQLVRGAKLSGLDIAFNWTKQLVLRIIWEYKLAAVIPIDGSATYHEISAGSGLAVPLVVRVIRAAMTLNIFDESKPGHIRHTAISRLLATNEGFYSLVGIEVEDFSPASTELIAAWKAFGGNAGEPDQSAFGRYNGGRSLFTVLAEDPDRARRFDSAMKYFIEEEQLDSFDIVKAFDWSVLDKPGSRVVDLGGGYGQVSQELAKHTQNIAFIIQDLPHVVEQGQKILPSDLANRVSFQAQNFLEPQKAENDSVDAFLISRCLHNWSDLYSSRILLNLIPALRNGSKVLIWDAVLDESPVKQLSERYNIMQDFIMATICNGKDRSAQEFRDLFELSDERFVVESIRTMEGCKLSMVEVTWIG